MNAALLAPGGRLLLASRNAGKLAEFRPMLAPLGIEISLPRDLRISAVEETAASFVENALLKARNACRECPLPALADDSGLCVDALDGAPGLISARFAGRRGDDAANNELLLGRMAGIPSERRQAHFVCVLVLLRHAADPDPLIASGRWYGTIAESPRGAGGFGYDPLFLDPELGLSAAELAPGLKAQRSHRGQAVAGLLSQLRTGGRPSTA